MKETGEEREREGRGGREREDIGKKKKTTDNRRFVAQSQIIW